MARLRNTCLVCIYGLTVALISSNVSATQTIKLATGHDMPVVGLGTWQIKPEDVDAAVTTALENGYKHIDTAYVYLNEEAIGKTLKKWFDKGNKREDLFITTKLPFVGNRASDVELYLQSSLNSLGLGYVDMYLIHAPTGVLRKKDSLEAEENPDGTHKLDFETDHISTWKAMEAQVKAGRAKSIGLSNFNETQIQNIINIAEIKPSNLQVELQAYNQQKSLRDFCNKNNIAVTAYSSLGSSSTKDDYKSELFKSMPKPLDNPVVTKIAKAHNKTPAQVLLRHQVQEGIIVIPKSTKPDRIRENINIFDFQLTADELKELDGLDKGEDGRLFNFLVFKGIEKHKHFPWSAQLAKVKA